MIDCVSCPTAHLFGDAIASQHRLRYRIFIERKNWKLPTYEGMEFDNYDTPATTYFIWRDRRGEARGVARAKPTVCPYMLEQVFPHMVTAEPIPKERGVWEGSRIGVDRDLAPELRQRVLGELFCAYLEFGLREGIERYLILMPVYMLKKLASVGWPTRVLGPVERIDRMAVAAASIQVSQPILKSVREHMQIPGPILRTADDLVRPAAA